MNAIEFTAIAHDGVIDLPAHYQGQWNEKRVRVICLESDASPTRSATAECVQEEAFGLWSRLHPPIDGLEYQDRLRSEWQV
ncbi:MAG: hypothetical protein ACRESZ_03180 [Methylococcales bacterium]